MALLALVAPAEWIKRTDLPLQKRAGAIASVDTAYAAYHRTRDDTERIQLHDALTAYLKAKGGHWEKVDRNKKSEGLMRYIYESTASVPMSAMPMDVLSKRIPEARHGVMYLWMNTRVETQWLKVILEGGLSMGGATNTLFGKDGFNRIPTGLATQLSSLGGKAATVGGIGLGISREQKTAVAATPRDKLVHLSDLDIGAVHKVDTTPRRKIVELSDLDLVSTSDEPGFESAPGLASHLKTKIREVLNQIFDKLSMQLTGGFGTVVAGASKGIEALARYIFSELWKKSAPFLGAGIDIGRGIADTCFAVKDRIQSYLARQKFVVTPGHPALIVSSIERQMEWNIAKGLYKTCLGAAKMAGTAFTGAASVIVEAIAALLEFAVRVLQRMIEGKLTKSWTNEVRSSCSDRTQWKADPNDGVLRPSICYDDRAFARLFERGCNASVCIPMLTLNSGICGDQMMFMKMFDDTSDKNIISQKAFNTATKYFSGLKVMGREYVLSSGFAFTSHLDDVTGYLKHAVEHHNEMADWAHGEKPKWAKIAAKFLGT